MVEGVAPQEVRAAFRSTASDSASHQSLSTTRGTRVTRDSGIGKEWMSDFAALEEANTWSARRKRSGHPRRLSHFFQVRPSRGSREFWSHPKRKAVVEKQEAK